MFWYGDALANAGRASTQMRQTPPPALSHMTIMQCTMPSNRHFKTDAGLGSFVHDYLRRLHRTRIVEFLGTLSDCRAASYHNRVNMYIGSLSATSTFCLHVSVAEGSSHRRHSLSNCHVARESVLKGHLVR